MKSRSKRHMASRDAPNLHRILLLAAASLVQSSYANLVTSCSAGQYLQLNEENHKAREGLCLTCPAGSECPSETPTITGHRKCNKGYFSGYGQTSCTKCWAGWYCSDQTQVPEPCPEGKYAHEGSVACLDCPTKGAVCRNGNLIVCTPGYYCDNSSSKYPEPIKCPAGSRCPDGKNVHACPTGYYSTEGSSACTPCPIGSRCPNKDHEPIACPFGTYQDQPGQTSCTTCPNNKVCPAVDKPPQDCPEGSYAVKGGKSCFQCPAGVSCSYNGSTGALTYGACAVGTYSAAGMGTCVNCPGGKSCPDQKSVGADCSTGEYSKDGDLHCQPCPAGFYCPNKDRAPIKCIAGYYADAGKTTCTQCPAGSSCEKPDEMPRKCPEGQTADAGQTFCMGCPVGFSCKDGASTACTLGQIPNQHGTECIDCPKGMACPTRQYANQVACGPGYYSTDGMAFCEVSPAGKYAPTTIDQPQDCADGWYSDIGWTYCLQCPPGFQCKDKTTRHIALCQPGSFYTGDGACVKCPVGKMCPIAIPGYRADGLQCPAGTFAPERSFDCELCKPGRDCSQTPDQSADNAACTPNSAYSLGGWAQCQPCPKNYECPFGETIGRCPIFSYSEAGETWCQPCPDGGDCQDQAPPPCVNAQGEFTNCLDPAQDDSPVTCRKGFYALAHDMTCKACPKGHYCENDGTTMPVICPGGKYANEGEATCSDCPDEFYSKAGSEYCSPIPPGYKYKSDKTDIEVCPHKTYSRWGEDTCSTCPDGYLCPQQSGNGWNWHNSCPRGSWCKEGVETKCAAGKFGIMERGKTADVCVDCPPGYNCLEGTADFVKVPCPKGGYCEAGKTVVPCPAGTFNDELYARSLADCKTCPIGHQCGLESTDGGSLCAEGYYCPRGSGDPPLPCPAGTHGNSQRGKKDVNECLPCPPGHYCPEGSAAPTPAPAGFYTPLSGMPSAASLYKCPATFYCPNTGMSTFKGYFCQAGYVCPAGSKAATEVECPEGTFSDRRDLLDPRHCDICPKGYSCMTHSTSADIGSRIVVCPQNRFCPDGTKSSKIPICPAGSYAPFTGAKSQYDCLPCPAGKYCDGLTDGAPKDCEKGHYCPPGTKYADQFPCPIGYYNDEKGSKSSARCLHCGFQKYCPDVGLETPVDCPQGTYNDASTTAAYCTVCEAGYYCPASRVYKVPCQKGFYSERGWWYEAPCPVGTYCPNEATTDEQMRDQLCPAGSFCQMTISYTDLKPAVNQMMSNVPAGINVWPNTLQSGSAGQYACPQYKYCPEGTKTPLDIVRGTMQHFHAAGTLIDAVQMPKGRYSKVQPANSDPPFVTTVCEKGYYCPPGSFEPIPCPAGSFRNNEYGHDADSCGKCRAGSYCPTKGTHTPTECPKGHFCPEGAKTPQPCPRGTYNDVKNIFDSRGCKPCQAGHYCPFLGQESTDTVNRQCDAGYYCIEGSQRPEPTDEVTGSRCPTGRYCGKGAAVPSNCPQGEYGPYEGLSAQTQCIPCKPGYYCLGSSQSSATNMCKAGIYCLEGAIQDTQAQAGVVFEAAIGSYVLEGSFFEILCQEGTFNGDPALGSCQKCEAGYFCDQLGTTKTVYENNLPCAKGHYCLSYEAYEAEATAAAASVVDYRQIPCEPGTYNDLTGKNLPTDCKACPAEKACEFKGVTGTSDMVDCAAGYFCKSGASTRYPEDTSQTQNGPCQPGYYCEAGTENPTPCPEGTFSKQWRATDASFCLPCPVGYLCLGTGNADAVEKIDAGKFGDDGINTAFCGTTIAGTGSVLGLYCPVGSHLELICPMGFYQRSASRGQCFECPPGSFCMSGVDEICLEGYYCP